jgi:hypothetical protein
LYSPSRALDCDEFFQQRISSLRPALLLPETHHEKSQVVLRLSRRAKADPIIEDARGDFLKGTITVFRRRLQNPILAKELVVCIPEVRKAVGEQNKQVTGMNLRFSCRIPGVFEHTEWRTTARQPLDGTIPADDCRIKMSGIGVRHATAAFVEIHKNAS